MVHLRIVAPAKQSQHVLDLLDDNESVVNLVRLEHVALHPEGDLILADVARDQASLVVADLRELNIDVDGSIAISEIDSQVSAAAERAMRAGRKRHPDPVVWEEVAARTSEGIELTHSFLLFMAFAMLLASVGIVLEQPILIVGAMVVGPDFGPIAGACVAIVDRRPALVARSIRALAIGFPVGIAATAVATLGLNALGEFPATLDLSASRLTRFLSEPSFFSAYVALIAGIVGMLSLTSAKSGALVGVLISVATIPAGASMGLAAAYGDWSDFGQAAAQLGLNIGAIFAGGLITLRIQRLLYTRQRHRHLAEGGRARAGLPIGSSARTGKASSRPEGF